MLVLVSDSHDRFSLVINFSYSILDSVNDDNHSYFAVVGTHECSLFFVVQLEFENEP